MVLQISIVIPTFNGAAYITSSMTSILCQDGNYHVHIHIQDGGSTDDTIQIAEETFELCNQLAGYQRTCSFSSQITEDNSVYDAISKGFDNTPPSSIDIMTWLGVDDMLNNCSLSTVSTIFSQMPDVDWVTGEKQMFSRDTGSLTHTNIGNNGFSPFTLENGWNDGRTYGFIQQEGSFWRRSLWNKVGGLDPSYELAGDWDLWRRFSKHSRLYKVENIALGMFGIRKGQLSEKINLYYDEIGPVKRYSLCDCQNLIKKGMISSEFNQQSLLIKPSHQAGWTKAKNRYEPCIRPSYGLPVALTDLDTTLCERWAQNKNIEIIAATSSDGEYYLIIGYQNKIENLQVSLNHNDHTEHKVIKTYSFSKDFGESFHIIPLSITQEHINLSMAFNKPPLMENGELGLLFTSFILVPKAD